MDSAGRVSKMTMRESGELPVLISLEIPRARKLTRRRVALLTSHSFAEKLRVFSKFLDLKFSLSIDSIALGTTSLMRLAGKAYLTGEPQCISPKVETLEESMRATEVPSCILPQVRLDMHSIEMI